MAEDFSPSLNFFYGSPGINKFQFLIRKKDQLFLAVYFTLIFGHRTLDPDLDLLNVWQNAAAHASYHDLMLLIQFPWIFLFGLILVQIGAHHILWEA